MPKQAGVPIKIYYDEGYYNALLERKGKASKNNDALKDSNPLPIGSMVAV